MFSLRTIPRKAGGSLCKYCLSSSARPLSTTTSLKAVKLSTARLALTTRHHSPSPTFFNSISSRTYASKTSADSLIDTIQDQYATARDEFEIATEETEKKSLYGEGDRAAAREELDKLKEMFEAACRGEDGEEVKRRIGGRIRELDHAVIALEESALEH